MQELPHIPKTKAEDDVLIGWEKVITMLRCLTVDKETLIASTCDKEDVKKLSNEKKLICPNCQSTVIFKPGKVMRPHFAHYESECVITNYEPETASHLKGKQVLYEWLKMKFPAADVEYEVYIPETNQIADIFVEHAEEGMEGLRWAFEFQHSRLSSTDWESRHNLYKSAGIQAFWILDKAKYLKFSSAKGHTDARKRNELEKKIYDEVGLCYFLDLDIEELTIDFNFVYEAETNIFNRKKVTTHYTYHRPEEHSAPLNKIRFRMNEEFKYNVLLIDEIENQMNDRLIWIVKKLKRQKELLLEEELQKRIPEKKSFAKNIYNEDEAQIACRFIEENERHFAEDIRNLSDGEFYEVHKSLIDKVILNVQTFRALEKSQELKHKLIVSVNYSWDLYKISFINNLRSLSLEDYLALKEKDKIQLVEYAYNKYKDIFDKLKVRHRELTNNNLKKIKWFLAPDEKNPSAVDYALVYRRCSTKEEIDEYVNQIVEKIINYNPFANMNMED